MRHALLLTLLWILTFPTPGVACCAPQSHPGLWDAIEGAKAIAVVRVEGVEPSDTFSPSKLYDDGYQAGMELASRLGADWLQSAVRSLPEPDWNPKYRAKVQVLDVLKGSIKAGRTTNLYSTLSCTEGGFFVPGRTLIAFLHKRSGGWHPLPWLDSTTYFEHASGLAEMSRVVLQGVDLQARGPATSSQRRTWVRDTVRSAGRQWLGPADLELLSDEEVTRAFVDVPSIDPFNLRMLARLAHVESPEVTHRAMQILEAWLADPDRNFFYAPGLLRHIETRLGHPMEASTVSASLRDEETSERWQALQQQLGIVDLDAARTIDQQASFSSWLDTLFKDAMAVYP